MFGVVGLKGFCFRAVLSNKDEHDADDEITIRQVEDRPDLEVEKVADAAVKYAVGEVAECSCEDDAEMDAVLRMVLIDVR